MEKFFKILYYSGLSFFVFFVAYLSVMLSISPKKDLEKRGFIPCTEKFVLEAGACEKGSIGCTFGCLWRDTKCNAVVIADGFGLWIQGLQSAPWSNYLFEPVVAEKVYDGNVADEMLDLENKRQENEQNHINAEKDLQHQLNLNTDMLMSDEKNSEPDYDAITKIDAPDLGGISDEVFEVKSDKKEEKTDEK